MVSKYRQKDILSEFVYIKRQASGEECYQYQGEILLSSWQEFTKRHFRLNNIQPKGGLKLIVVGHHRDKAWVMNQMRVAREDVISLWGNDKLFNHDCLNIFAGTIKIYNPERTDEKRRHLPIAILRKTLHAKPMLIALDCDMNEAVSLLTAAADTRIL